MCGIPSFKTADMPLAPTIGATQEQVPFACSNGEPGRRDHRRVSSSSIAGKLSSHSCRSPWLRQFALSSSGIIIDPVEKVSSGRVVVKWRRPRRVVCAFADDSYMSQKQVLPVLVGNALSDARRG